MIKKIKNLTNILLRIFFTLKKINFMIPSFNDEKADWLIFIPDFFSKKILGGDLLQRVIAQFYYLRLNQQSVTLYTKLDIGKFKNKKIIFYGRYLNTYGFLDHSIVVRFLSNELTKQNNKVFPNPKEAALWENKAHMYELFNEKKIRTPKTHVMNIDEIDDIFVNGLEYPVLIKEEHSCSSVGVYKIDSSHQLLSLIRNNEYLNKNRKVIIQKLLNIRRDLRVIIVGDKIVLHYWRINTKNEWEPTSTSHGSKVDFENFPENWREWIMETFYKLEIRTGAFDIAWDNDDINQEPYILEVSPFYQPNPKPCQSLKISYGEWKKSLYLRNSYQSAFTDVMFDIQKEIIDILITS